MKKFFLISIFILSLISISVSAKDFDNSIPMKEIEFLKENNVIVGDPNGDLREKDEITRAEFVTVLCRAIGIENLAMTDEMKFKGTFNDVPSSHWAAGYIYAATEYGAINGMEDGLFYPEEPVTNEQAIKILVAAWGYTDEAEKAGGYPNGYMEVAQKFGITDSVLFNYGLASKRWVVSVFTYNMLSVEPKEKAISLIATTDIEKADKPKGENGEQYIKNPENILAKITPETIKYERKIFEQRVPEGEEIPVELKNDTIQCYEITQYDVVTMSVGKDGEKDGQSVNLKQKNNFNISNLTDGEYKIIVTGRKDNIIDTYYVDLIISEGTQILGECFRITYLKHQPIVEEKSEEISIDSNSDFDLIFNIKVDADDKDKVVMCIDYPVILNDGESFNYDIVSENNETLYESIKGENKEIETMIIDNLTINTPYNVSIGLFNNDGSHNAIKGVMTFVKENEDIKFNFVGNHSFVIFKGYKIGE